MDQDIIQLIRQNKDLVLIDATHGHETGVNDLLLQQGWIDLPDRSLVFLYLDNSISSISMLLNLFNSAHVLALLSPRLNPSFKSSLETLYRPSLIFDPSRQEIIDYIRKPVTAGLQIFQNTNIRPVNLHPTLKLMLSTSGTTGSPKFVKLSSDNLLQNALSIIDYLPIFSEDVVPLNLPVYYSYGLSILTTNCIQGGKIICTNKDILNKDFWSEFGHYGFTSLAGVPYVYEVLYRIGFTKKKYLSLRYLTQAGGQLNTGLINVFCEYARNNSILFYVMYGQTEATARMSFLDPQYLETKAGSIGKPIRGGRFHLDEHIGELCYQGPNVFGGYASGPDDLSSYSSNRELRTGDIASVDEDGFYYITGRTKRFVKIIGSRINLDEVETMLKNHFHGKSFYALGLHDQYILVVTCERDFDHEIIVQFISGKLGLHRSFIKTRVLENIPLTENGKVNYTMIQQQHDGK
jgi:long-chain acyl-CoA synthetase